MSSSHQPPPFLAGLSIRRLSNIHLPEISFDIQETHEAQDPAGVSEIIYERLDAVKERERRSILRALKKCCCCIPGDAWEQEYAPISPTLSEPSDDPEPSSFFTYKPSKNIVDPCGLSIIERVFFKSPPNRPQVIMSLALQFILPPSVKDLDPQRIVDLIRIAQSKHYRCSSFVDPVTMNAHPLAHTADKLPCNYRFIQKTADPSCWQTVYTEEINTNFDVNDVGRPLWRAAIIVPLKMMPKPGSLLQKGESHLPPAQQTRRLIFGSGKGFGEALPECGDEDRSFRIIFSFHHCLGDGLSMFAFCRTFAECTDVQFLTNENLHLENRPVVKEPPPLLDNVVNPYFLEVLPAAVSMAFKSFLRRGRARFQPQKPIPKPNLHSRVHSSASSMDNLTAPSSPHPHPTTIPSSPSLANTNPIQLLRNPHQPQSQTNTRFLWFPSDFTTLLRETSRSHKTSIAAVLVVTSLTATLAILRTRTSTSTSNTTHTETPTHQGWVVTNSIRHLLPTSHLLTGGPRETDPALKLFGGYAGSVMNNNLKLTGTSKLWSRCRSVKATIGTCLRESMRRMKVVNYCYRYPKVWRMIERRTDLGALSRGFSVEVANLGAWEDPFWEVESGGLGEGRAAGDGIVEEGLGLGHFGGVVNSSFDGVRGLFTLGVITLRGDMSVAVAYDALCVTEGEAALFVQVFCQVLRRIVDAGDNATVDDLLRACT
ncbi:hypothetical protein BCR33DRAFT_855228 [Rhizoclosmatium globosum]|uniref:Uncharacterized protein n=1 Tax=Rhizoclosmatium globosum TaxID=329046 RepID=A0A1Y2BP06_9FUNG|nr:hypothetical protein BCR33DRAFT_855228 [Rhizoclosmatium globosum]|eukprot:ORY36490.1 hypothetical protein BCR33DRAFT_855228 [Rhizoclosmatium globosum]